jgi:hypothetical protein
MTLMQKIAYLKKVWHTLLPHVAMPTSEDAARWCPYPLEAVEAALLRTAKRFAPARIDQGFVPRQAYSYATATARNISCQQHLNTLEKTA